MIIYYLGSKLISKKTMVKRQMWTEKERMVDTKTSLECRSTTPWCISLS